MWKGDERWWGVRQGNRAGLTLELHIRRERREFRDSESPVLRYMRIRQGPILREARQVECSDNYRSDRQ